MDKKAVAGILMVAGIIAVFATLLQVAWTQRAEGIKRSNPVSTRVYGVGRLTTVTHDGHQIIVQDGFHSHHYDCPCKKLIAGEEDE